MVVRITFKSPSRMDPPGPPVTHRRSLECVPPATADEMAQDFRAYQNGDVSDPEPTSGSNPWKLYRYVKEGEEEKGEVVVPLDFREIVDLTVASPPD
jgi:hypothetical protein